MLLNLHNINCVLRQDSNMNLVSVRWKHSGIDVCLPLCYFGTLLLHLRVNHLLRREAGTIITHLLFYVIDKNSSHWLKLTESISLIAYANDSISSIVAELSGDMRLLYWLIEQSQKHTIQHGTIIFKNIDFVFFVFKPR